MGSDFRSEDQGLDLASLDLELACKGPSQAGFLTFVIMENILAAAGSASLAGWRWSV